MLESSSDTGNDFLQFGVIHAKEVLVILCIKPKFSDQMAEQTMFLSLVQYISHITFSLFFFAKNTFKNKNKNIQPYKKSTAWVTSPSMSSAGQEMERNAFPGGPCGRDFVYLSRPATAGDFCRSAEPFALTAITERGQWQKCPKVST